jgi:hypothetical protein
MRPGAWHSGTSSYPSSDDTPVERTASLLETVTVTDPNHHLYGLTLTLRRVELHPRLGRVCVVVLYPNVERLLSATLTDLDSRPFPRPDCRLSIMAITQLLAILVPCITDQQEQHYEHPGAVAISPAALSAQQATPTPTRAISSTQSPSSSDDHDHSSPGVAQLTDHSPSPTATDAGPHHSGEPT